jgi:UDP-2-acetamido-3-amino-2,3-dideoxy-glucuronate N-acetyltransferase
MNFFAHSSACIDAGARIGEHTKIWHFSHVMPRAMIGSHCSLGQNVYVANDVVIGNYVKIQNNVSLYEGVVLDDYVFCGPSMVFTNVKIPRSAFPRNSSKDYVQTRVGYGASIGANATIICGVKLGAWSFIAAGAVVTKDVCDYSVVVGVPGRHVGWACECGRSLPVHNASVHMSCKECGCNYQLLAPSTLVKMSPSITCP